MMVYCQLDPWEQIQGNFTEFTHFQSRKCIWKCRLRRMAAILTRGRWVNVTSPWSALPDRECQPGGVTGGPIPFAYIPGEFLIAAILPFHERSREGFLECDTSFYRSRMIQSTEALLYAVDLFNDPNGGFEVCSKKCLVIARENARALQHVHFFQRNWNELTSQRDTFCLSRTPAFYTSDNIMNECWWIR